MLPEVQEWLRLQGAECAKHKPRKVDFSLIENSSLVVAMARVHQTFLWAKFGVKAPLFLEVAYGRQEGVPDVDDKFPDFPRVGPSEESLRYALEILALIHEAMPHFVQNLGRYVEETPRILSPR